MCGLQCPVCSMKCTGACSGPGPGAVCSVQCAVCSVLSATGDELTVEIGVFEYFSLNNFRVNKYKLIM